PSISADAWFIFGVKQFNPLQVYPILKAEVRNVSNNQPTVPAILGWASALPGAGWTSASQYLHLDAQPIASGSWGVQIYNDNTSNGLTPHFVDPTPANTINPDSDPSGLLMVSVVGSTSSQTLPLAWSIKDNTTTIPASADPNNTGDANSFQWLFLLDKNKPA